MPKRPLSVDELFCFVATDEHGDEGVVGFQDPATLQWYPLVGADMDRVESLKPIARKIAQQSGREVRLYHFSKKRVLEKIKP